MARHYGWASVSDSPMDYGEFLLSLQLLAEERTGSKVRAAKHAEDAQWRASHRALNASPSTPLDARARSTRIHDL